MAGRRTGGTPVTMSILTLAAGMPAAVVFWSVVGHREGRTGWSGVG
jgi:hypothetical protein